MSQTTVANEAKSGAGRRSPILFQSLVLTDPEKRKTYDEFGLAGLQAGFDPNQAREYQRWAGSGGAGAGRRSRPRTRKLLSWQHPLRGA